MSDPKGRAFHPRDREYPNCGERAGQPCRLVSGKVLVDIHCTDRVVVTDGVAAKRKNPRSGSSPRTRQAPRSPNPEPTKRAASPPPEPEPPAVPDPPADLLVDNTPDDTPDIQEPTARAATQEPSRPARRKPQPSLF